MSCSSVPGSALEYTVTFHDAGAVPDLQLVTGLSVYTMNKLLIFSQTAHLMHAAGRALTESEASVARARYVRSVLAAEAKITD